MSKILSFSILFAVLTSCSHTQPDANLPSSNFVDPKETASYVNLFHRFPAEVSRKVYQTDGECKGYPRIKVATAPGFCVGLVYDGSADWKKARWSTLLPGGILLIVDMGGWATHKGSLWALDLNVKPARAKLLLNGAALTGSFEKFKGMLDRPNQITAHSDGFVYLGAAAGIYRWRATDLDPRKSLERIIGPLPSAGLHPLKSFAFDENNHLYINIGSASNVCVNDTRYGSGDPKLNPNNPSRKQKTVCSELEHPELGQGLIRKYNRVGTDYSPKHEIYAKGLRNSIGLVYDPIRKVVLQTENSRDAINKVDPKINTDLFPSDEINVLRKDAHYGWPYCYDKNKTSPEWSNINCQGFTPPQVLLPAHSAPLGALLHSGFQWPPWYKGRLLVALHGYLPKGHRIIAMKRDEQGLPTGIPQSLVYAWGEQGQQGMGRPVALTELPTGDVIIVEDDPQNKILLLHYDADSGLPGMPVQEIDQTKPPTIDPGDGLTEEQLKTRLQQKLSGANPPPFALFQDRVIDRSCVACHATAGSPGVLLKKYDDEGNARRIWISGKAPIVRATILGDAGAPAMPPEGWESADEKKQALRWFDDWMASQNQ